MNSYPSLERLKRLISALSSSQKRDFRRYIQPVGSEDTRYLRLFDAIVSELKKPKFSKDFPSDLDKRKVIKKGEFSVVAGILNEKILESMRSNPRSRSAKAQLCRMICDIQFLADMELYPDSLFLLEKAHDLAVKHDYPIFLLDLYAIEKEVLFLSRHLDFFKRLDEIRAKEATLIQRLQADQEIYGLNIEVLKRIIQNGALPAESALQLLDWHNKVQTDSGSTAEMAFRTRRRLHIALMNDLDYVQSREGTGFGSRFYYAEKIVQLYKAFPQFKAEEPDLYVQHLGLYLSLALECNRYDIFEETQTDLQEIGSSAVFFRSIIPVYLHWYFQTHNFEGGCEYIKKQDLLKQLDLFQDKMTPSRYMTICFMAFQLIWKQLNYGDALQWLEQIIQYKPSSFHIDIQCYARFLQISVMWDCRIFHTHRNPSTIIEALQRWLHNRNLKSAYYQNLLILVREIAELPDSFYKSDRFLKALAQFEEDLGSRSADSAHLNLLLEWCKNKVKNKR